MNNLMRWLILALALAAFAATAAQAGTRPNDRAGALGVGSQGVNSAVASSPDVFERYAVAHPYGQAEVQTIDGRSADTPDAAHAARQASFAPSDGRSPDTLDAASAPQPVVFTQVGGFHWSNAGIGAGFAGGLLLVGAAVGSLWLR